MTTWRRVSSLFLSLDYRSSNCWNRYWTIFDVGLEKTIISYVIQFFSYHDVGGSHDQISRAWTDGDLLRTVPLRKLDHVQGHLLRQHARSHPGGDAGTKLCTLDFGIVPVEVDPNAGAFLPTLALERGHVVADGRVEQVGDLDTNLIHFGCNEK